MKIKYSADYPENYKEYYAYIMNAKEIGVKAGVKVERFINYWYPNGEPNLYKMEEAGLIIIKDGVIFNNVVHPDDVIIMSCEKHGDLTKKGVRLFKSYRSSPEHYKGCRLCANDSVTKYRKSNKDKIKARRQALQEKLKQRPNRILSELERWLDEVKEYPGNSGNVKGHEIVHIDLVLSKIKELRGE